MTEATVIKFCTHVGCIKPVVLGWGSCELWKFWEISDNISKMVQDTDIVTMED